MFLVPNPPVQLLASPSDVLLRWIFLTCLPLTFQISLFGGTCGGVSCNYWSSVVENYKNFKYVDVCVL